MENSNNTGKIMLWIGAGCLLLAVCIAAVMVFSLGGLLWLVRAPMGVNVDIDSPIQAEVGDTIQIVVRVTNTASNPTELTSIDIGLEYLEGVVITSSTPAFDRVDEVSGPGDNDYQTYYFYQPIAPGETVTVTFDGDAIAAGDFRGSFDVCIGSEFSCLDNFIRMIVE